MCYTLAQLPAIMESKNQKRHISTSEDIEVSTYLEIAKDFHGEQPAVESTPASKSQRETIVIFDFGSQYSRLIARRVRECHVYCELIPFDAPWDRIVELNPKGFILSGGPSSVYEKNAPMPPAQIYGTHLPILGICYGMQLLTHQLGGKVTPGTKREYGHAVLHFNVDLPLFSGLPPTIPVWMSHGDLDRYATSAL